MRLAGLALCLAMSPAALVAQMVGAPAGAGDRPGHELEDRFSARFGIGPTLQPELGTGAHLLAAAEYFPTPYVGVRLDGLASISDYSYWGQPPDDSSDAVRVHVGLEPLFSTNLAVVFREPPGPYRLYGFLGMGYNYFDPWSRAQPLEHDLGFIYGGGLIAQVGERSWFIESTGRVWGNVLSYRQTWTKWIWPVTVGVSL